MATIKPYTLFMVGLLAGSGGALAVTTNAAPGDLIVEQGGARVCITAPQALCYASCAISDGTWTGASADMLRVKAWRESSCEGGFASSVRGLKSMSQADFVPGSGIQLHGIAE